LLATLASTAVADHPDRSGPMAEDAVVEE